MAIEVHNLFGDEAISLWAEPDGPIMVKIVERCGDPVEFNKDQALALADLLRSLAAKI